MRLFKELFGKEFENTVDLRSELASIYEYILHHDSTELIHGDLPFPIKRDWPALKEVMNKIEEKAARSLGVTLPVLNDHNLVRVKICDLLEMAEFALVETMYGSKYAQPIFTRICTAVTSTLDLNTILFSREERKRVVTYLDRLKTDYHQAGWRAP
jgi:5'-deoxynucleotidase YfbR-like HD superfamily hydrolase